MASEKCTLIPEQLFESQDSFIMHVKQYAIENGFNVRLDDVERDKGGQIRKRDIVCSAEGAPRGKDATGKREDSVSRSDIDEGESMTPRAAGGVAHSGAHRRKSMKTGCRWLARASRQSSGMWKIIMLRLEHNHPLTSRYEMFLPTSHCIRTGDDNSIAGATMAARAAMINGSYRGPSVEFKNLFLQMSAACADLCWSAARHPETIVEVLSEIRRLNQHLDRQADDYDMRSPRPHSPLPAPSEAADDEAPAADAIDLADKVAEGDSSLVAMGHHHHNVSAMINHHMTSHHQPSHFLADVAMAADSPAQIIARSQNRHNVDAQSPELDGSSAIISDAALLPTSPTTALPAAGPVKRPRGRPRKNPIAADNAGLAKPAKSKAQQKREQREQQQQQHIPPPTPTPADLASLTHQIITQNAASSPANVQRSIASSLALPSQPMQVHSHQASSSARASIIGATAATAGNTGPPILDPRSHAASVQRQQQQPVPQPQQSPTFFLGAAEGIGYSERPTTATTANLGHSTTTAATAGSHADAPETVGDPAFVAYQKSSRATWESATAPASVSTTGFHQYSTPTAAAAAAAAAATAYAATYAPSSSNALRRGGLPSPTTTTTAAAAAAAVTAVPPAIPVSRAAVSAISDPAKNASASVDTAYPTPLSSAAVGAGRFRFDDASVAGVGSRSLAKAAAAQTSSASPYLGAAASSSIAAPNPPTFPTHHSYYHPQQQSQYHYQQRADQQQSYYADQQQSDSASAAVSPPVSGISHLVISSNSSVPPPPSSAASHQSHQLSRLSNMHSAADHKAAAAAVATQQRMSASHHYQSSHSHLLQQQQQHQPQQLFQLGSSPSSTPSSMQAAVAASQMGRDPASAAQLNSYLIMSRAQHKQSNADQSSALSSLPPMANNSGAMLPNAGARRFDEFQLNQYHNMNNWQM